jgi:hypothetical protein
MLLLGHMAMSGPSETVFLYRLGREFAWFQCCVYSNAHSTAEQANCAIIVRLIVCVLRRVPLFFLRKLRWLETTSDSFLFKRLEP